MVLIALRSDPRPAARRRGRARDRRGRSVGLCAVRRRRFAGSASHRARDGAVVLGLLLVLAAGAALLTARDASADDPALGHGRWWRRAAAAAVAAVAIGLVAGGLGERPSPPSSAPVRAPRD